MIHTVTYMEFLKMYEEARAYEDVGLFIAERGWEDWMDELGEDGAGEISSILQTIFEVSRMNFLGMASALGTTRSNLAAAYGIPVRTTENWDREESGTLGYIKPLLAYTVAGELLSRRGESEIAE